MLIQRKLKDRPEGTFITMADSTRYAFLPDEYGRHVAEVTDPAHIERLLSIPEGFGIVSETFATADEAQDAFTAIAEDQADPDADELDAIDDDADDDFLDDDFAPEGEPMIPLEAMTLTDLQAVYEQVIGRKPHHRAGIDKLIEEITAHRATQE